MSDLIIARVFVRPFGFISLSFTRMIAAYDPRRRRKASDETIELPRYLAKIGKIISEESRELANFMNLTDDDVASYQCTRLEHFASCADSLKFLIFRQIWRNSTGLICLNLARSNKRRDVPAQ